MNHRAHAAARPTVPILASYQNLLKGRCIFLVIQWSRYQISGTCGGTLSRINQIIKLGKNSYLMEGVGGKFSTFGEMNKSS